MFDQSFLIHTITSTGIWMCNGDRNTFVDQLISILFFRFESLLTQNEGHGCFLYVWYVTLNLKAYHVCLVNQEFFFQKYFVSCQID